MVHVPDGFLDVPTSLACGAVAVAGVGAAVRRAGVDLDDRRIPLAGLTAAYVFAVQMLNFPVAAGTSGHLLGGALAAALVGPWVAVLCLTVVVGIQALVFADGGLSALGVNLVLLALVAPLVGWTIHRLTVRLLGPAVSAAVAAWGSVVAASAVFVALYSIGGTGDVSLTAVASAMIGVHGLIGIGEAVITALTIAAVVATRPDLLYADSGNADRSSVAVGGAAP